MQSCKIYFIIDLIFIAMSFALSSTVNASFMFLIFPVIISGQLSINLLSFDEKSKWTKYSGALPYSAGQIVSAKYLFSIIFVAVTTLVMFLVLDIYANTIGGVVLSGAGVLFGGVCISSFLVTAVSLPLCFKFGTEKGRIIFFMVMFAGAFTLLSFVEKLYAIIMQITYIVWIIIPAVAALYALSWFISVAIYSKHEVTD